jgi:hypothetical protein
MSSPEDNGKKPLKKATIGSDGRYYGEIGESQELLELKTPRQIQKKEDKEALARGKKSVVEKFKEDDKSEKKAEAGNAGDGSEPEKDTFDDEGNIISGDHAALNIRIAELKASIALKFSQVFQAARERLEGPITRVKTINLKVFTVLLGGAGRAFSGFNRAFSKVLGINREELVPPKKTGEKAAEDLPVSPEEQFIKASFNDMINLNIIFTDNYDTAFYSKKKGNQEITKTENSIMMLNAIEAIRQCAEFTKDVPPIQDGYYKGSAVSKLMTEVSETEIAFFLGYVKAKPAKYIGKQWKISETFATWLVGNAPMAEKIK